MPFITQRPEGEPRSRASSLQGRQAPYGVNKTNWKFLLIIVVLAIVVGGGVLWHVNTSERLPVSSFSLVSYAAIGLPKTEQKSAQEQSCIDSGGTVATASCCKSSDDFPNSCLVGACGCSPADNHQVSVCDCGEGKCFDGEKCISEELLEPEAQCYFNEMIFYYREGCGWCGKVKSDGSIEKLEDLGVRITQINVLAGPVEHQFSGVPTFVINNKVYVGYRTFEQLKELLGCQ